MLRRRDLLVLAAAMTVALGVLTALACDATRVATVTGPEASGSVVATPAPAPAVASAEPAPTQQPQQAPAPRLIVRLIAIGPVPADTLEQAAKGLREHAHVEAVIEEAQRFPPSARSPRAGAYWASHLLDWLESLPVPPTGKLMGITEADIVTPKDGVPVWGILGMGSIDGRCSVLSTYRMRRKWEDGGAPESVVRTRLWKIAVHELGHTLGLEHCPQVGCIMEDGHGTVKTVDRDENLCAACAQRFEHSLQVTASSSRGW